MENLNIHTAEKIIEVKRDLDSKTLTSQNIIMNVKVFNRIATPIFNIIINIEMVRPFYK